MTIGKAAAKPARWAAAMQPVLPARQMRPGATVKFWKHVPAKPGKPLKPVSMAAKMEHAGTVQKMRCSAAEARSRSASTIPGQFIRIAQPKTRFASTINALSVPMEQKNVSAKVQNIWNARMKNGLKEAVNIPGRFVSIRAVQSSADMPAMNRAKPKSAAVRIIHTQRLAKIHPQIIHFQKVKLSIVSGTVPKASAAMMATNIPAPVAKRYAVWMANPTNARAAAGDPESSVQRDAMKKRVNAIIPAARPETSNAVKMTILCISATTQKN